MPGKIVSTFVLVGVITVVVCSSIALADDIPILATGSRVRASVVDYSSEDGVTKSVKGILIGQDATSITVDDGKLDAPLVIQFENLVELETCVQEYGRGKGALIGVGVGAGIGALVGLASGDDPAGIISFSAESKAAMGAVVFGFVGGLLGIISSPGEKWEPVSYGQFQLGFSQGSHGESGFFISGRF